MPDYLPDDYKGVEKRIQEFREDHPNGMIETELVGMKEGAIGFYCRVETEDGAYGDGHGFGSKEIVQDTVGEKWREYAETVAVGRALRHLGYESTGGEGVSHKTESKPKKDIPKANIAEIKSQINDNRGWNNFSDDPSEKQIGILNKFWEKDVEGTDEEKFAFWQQFSDEDIAATMDLRKGEISPIIEQVFNNKDAFIKLAKSFVGGNDDDEDVPF